MSWSQRSQYLYVNDQAPVGLQYNQTTGIWETIFLDENQNKFASLADIFNNPVAPLPVQTTGTDLTLSGFLSAGARVQAGTHFRAPNDPTATTPVYGFTGATDKGMYPTANGLGFAVGGTRIGEVQSWGGGFTGNVIQVLNFSNSYAHTITNSSNWNSSILSAASTDWEVSITPKYTTSKILVLYSIMSEVQGGTNSYTGIKISRKIGSGSYSEILVVTERQFGFASGSVAGAYSANQCTYNYFDSPNTTSSISYKFPCRVNSGTTNYINGLFGGNISTVTLMEVQQ